MKASDRVESQGLLRTPPALAGDLRMTSKITRQGTTRIDMPSRMIAA
jgi:hypothetical protein